MDKLDMLAHIEELIDSAIIRGYELSNITLTQEELLFLKDILLNA